METLTRQLATLGIAEMQPEIEKRLTDQPSFALLNLGMPMKNEPLAVTFAVRAMGLNDYRLDAFHLGRILVPEKEIGGINTRSLENRIKEFNWQKSYRDYSLDDRSKIDQIWNDYWLLAKESKGKDIQARLFVKYWKDSEMGSGAPRDGLLPEMFQTFHRFPITDQLSFTVTEAFDLLAGKTVNKFTKEGPEAGSEKRFILLQNDELLDQKSMLFQFAPGYQEKNGGKRAANTTVEYKYDEFNNRELLTPAEQLKWSRKIDPVKNKTNSDIFQELPVMERAPGKRVG